MATMRTVLVVDDEAKIVQLARDYLEHAGFAVLTAADGRTAVEIARRQHPDLVVLDLGLPGLDGLEVTRELRRDSSIPIVMLTARDDELDKLLGLELGADDYLTKPFSPRELVARVKAVLRRTERAAEPGDVIRAGDVVLDVPRMRAEVAGRTVELTATEFGLLATLAASPGRIFTRSQLLDALRGVAFESYERAIDSHIKNLRRKVEPDPREPRYVLTVYGVGYRFADDRGRRKLTDAGRSRSTGGGGHGLGTSGPHRGPASRGRPRARRRGAGARGSAASSGSCSSSSSPRSSRRWRRCCRTSARSRWSSPRSWSSRSSRPCSADSSGRRRDLDRMLARDTPGRGRRLPGPRRAQTRSDLRPIQELARGFDTMAARLEADEEQRRTLLADVSHELRTPLAVITGNLEAILDGVYPPDEAHLTPILEETRVLERLIDDLRTLTLSEAGTLALHPEPTDPDVLVGDVVRSFTPAATRAGVRLAADVPDDLPILDIDPVRIREVLSNLVANALRHTPDGGSVTLGASRDRRRGRADGHRHRPGHRSGPAALRVRPVREGRHVTRLGAGARHRPRARGGPRRDDLGRRAGRWRDHVPGLAPARTLADPATGD